MRDRVCQPGNGFLQPRSSRFKRQAMLAVTSDLQSCRDQIDIRFPTDKAHELLITFKEMTEGHGEFSGGIGSQAGVTRGFTRRNTIATSTVCHNGDSHGPKPLSSREVSVKFRQSGEGTPAMALAS